LKKRRNRRKSTAEGRSIADGGRGSERKRPPVRVGNRIPGSSGPKIQRRKGKKMGGRGGGINRNKASANLMSKSAAGF